MLATAAVNSFTNPAIVSTPRSFTESAVAAAESPLDVRIYHTLAELRGLLQTLTAPRVMIVLDERFQGYAPSLLTRRELGGQLTLVTPHGLANAFRRVISAALGWDEIRIRRDAPTALAEMLATTGTTNRPVILWPAWRQPEEVRAA